MRLMKSIDVSVTSLNGARVRVILITLIHVYIFLLNPIFQNSSLLRTLLLKLFPDPWDKVLNYSLDMEPI